MTIQNMASSRQSAALVALAFPSPNAVPDRRHFESRNRARRFGEVRSLGEPVLVAENTYGYIVEAGSPLSFMSDASTAGARILPFREAEGQYAQPEMTSGSPEGRSGGYPGAPTPQGAKTAQGIESGGADPKNQDHSSTYSDHASSKVKAANYGATDSTSKARGLKEGTWVQIRNKLEATRIEMSGTQPIGQAVKGDIHPNDYFILGLNETRDGAVATLGRVSTLHQIGNSKLGQYVYNVDADKLLGVLEDRSKAQGSQGGILSKGYKAKSARSPRTKREGILGAMAGAAQTPQRESVAASGVVTTESVHSRGLQVLRHLGILGGKPLDAAPKTAIGQSLVTANAGNAGAPITEAIPATHARPVKGQQAAMLEAVASGQTSGRLKGGPFDVPLDPNLENTLAMYRTSMQAGAHMMRNAGIDRQVVAESQIADSMGGATSMDPADFARMNTLEQMLKDEGIDPADLSEEDLAELMQQIEAAESEEQENNIQDEDDDGDDDESSGGGLFEDLLPGDVLKAGGMAALLKARGYPNADMIAAKIEAGVAANEWFSLTGGSLQDAKRLQWLHVQAGQTGHF